MRVRSAAHWRAVLALGVTTLAVVGTLTCYRGPAAKAPRAFTAAGALAAPTSAPVLEREGYVVSASLGDLAALSRDHGLTCARTIPALDLALLEGPRGLLDALRADPRVESVSRNHTFEVAGACCEDDNEPRGSIEEGFRVAHARLVRTLGPLHADSFKGRGVRVAVLDTGFDAKHPNLSFSLGLSVTPDAWDRDLAGHGTAMASLVGARAPAGGSGLEGVAPEAELIGVRVSDAQGIATLADVAAGIVVAVDRGAQVILLSMGARLPAPALDEAVSYAEQRGVLVVAAAGNANVHQDLAPAVDERVLSVGCVDDAGKLAWGTALAATTDLLAPGVGVPVALPTGSLSEDGYSFVTGSSAAAAHVAGVAALVLQRRPATTPAELRALLRHATRPLPLFAGQPALSRAFPARVLDPAAVVAELGRTLAPAPRLVDARAFPQALIAGQDLVAVVRVQNPGLRPTLATRLQLTFAGQVLTDVAVPVLSVGGEQTLTLRTQAPAGFAGGDLRFECAGAQVAWPLSVATSPRRDLAFVSARADARPDGSLVLRATLEGRGAAPEGGRVRFSLKGVVLGEQVLAPLAAGETRELSFAARPEQVPVQGRDYEARFELVGRAADDVAADDAAALDLPAMGAKPVEVKAQYQQGGKLNIIGDAPYRVEPTRTYVPVMIYLAEKGDMGGRTWLQIEKVQLYERTLPDESAGRGNLVYEDVRLGQTTAPTGLVVLNEEGQPQRRGGAPDLRLFEHARVNIPGRYAILRVPRSALNIAPIPTAPEVRYLDLRVEWTNKRKFLLVATKTYTGTTTWVLQTTFAKEPRPQMPMGAAYYDAHVHTIAEWHQEDGLNLIAARKNLGGPIPMVKEAAYAIGLTDAVDAVKGRVVTTDHNSFLNTGDDIKERPPVGLTSVGSSQGLSEFDRYREIFGICASEEVAFKAMNAFFSLPGLNNLPLPTGAHMLTYRAKHQVGPWHGGSKLAKTLGEKQPTLELESFIRGLAKEDRAANNQAATYAAHPYSGSNGWSPEHFEMAFEHDFGRRTDLPVHVEGTGFVTKGLQLWNGDGNRRRLSSSKIDWEKLNPWADSDWQQGDDDWDERLWKNLIHYHQDHLEPLLSYELKGRPGVRFPRKVLGVAGNDAHGDFNFASSRQATILNLKSTFSVKSRAFGRVATYVYPEGQTASTPVERNFEAFLDGNSCLTDGPLLHVSVDAEDRFDGENLSWHDTTQSHEDADGRIGGGGDFDGRGTALVARGSNNLRYRYRYSTNGEFGTKGGAITHVSIYRSSVGDPNPTTKRVSGTEILEARGSLAVTGADQDLEEALDVSEEGALTATSALQFAAFTGHPMTLGVDERRCYTNPIYAVPYDVSVDVSRTETDAGGAGLIPAGALTVTLTFDISLSPVATEFEVKALDTSGASSDKATGAIDVLVGAGGNNGWGAANGVDNSVLTLTNQRAIPLNLDRYPSSDRVSLVVYSYQPLQDAFGNALNPIAHRFDEKGIGSGGGTGPALPRSTAPATTAPPATQAPQAPQGGGRRSGGGCSLAPSPAGGPGTLALLLLVLGLGGLRRRA
jgi:hypothetical protein